MDFNFEPQHDLLRRTVRQFCVKEVEPHVYDWDKRGHFPDDCVRKMGKLGFFGTPIPTRYGGQGGDWVGYHIVAEEVARACSSLRTTVSVQTSLCMTTIYKYGNEQQKLKYLPDLCSAKKLGAWALTEANAGSDAGNQETKVKREGDGYLLNGTKILISNGDLADVVVVFANFDRSKKHRALGAFIVEKGMKGFSPGVVDVQDKLGLRSSHTAELVLDDVWVPKENIIGDEGQGWKIAMGILNHGRLGVAAGAVGMMQACLDASVKHAREREAFGQPIGAFQLVQEMIANMSCDLEAGRLLVYRAAKMMDEGKDPTLAVSQAKLWTAQAVRRAAIDACQVHGGYAYSDKYPVERFFRDSLICGLYEGTNQVQQLIIARRLLGLK